AFGSYGRVLAGSDLRGGTPEKIAVVAHAPRIVEPSYVETDLYYRFVTPRGVKMRTVTTLAFDDTLFHYTGQFDARPALRNLFLEARTPQGITLWAGSRMYRGDDIYLFDWWPLDELNTVGGGASVARGDLDVAVQAGVNRLLDPFQYQTEQVADPEFGADTVTTLDRQRLIASSYATYHLGLPGGVDGKVKVYGELQSLPSGDRRRNDDTLEHLPQDWGATLGLQLGAWGFGGADSGSHANLFARWSKGLTAFDELAPATGLDGSLAAWPGASELVLGAAGAYGDAWGHVIAGAYTRRFVDADASTMDRDDGWEYAADIRPEVAVAGDVMAGVDVSYQARFPRGLSPTTLLAADPAVFQVAPMIVYAPMGRGAWSRPQLRLVWRIAKLNDAALDAYAIDDPRRAHSTVHFLGVQAEWWFNSSTR
ncbi:MAG: carbohydrate porin, partial [Myxococcales bacterium]|nr:carbohydrate porin [Myxococcales bacterium]